MPSFFDFMQNNKNSKTNRKKAQRGNLLIIAGIACLALAIMGPFEMAPIAGFGGMLLIGWGFSMRMNSFSSNIFSSISDYQKSLVKECPYCEAKTKSDTPKCENCGATL